MPRMNKKRKQELSFFLNDRGRVSYSALCRSARIRASRASGPWSSTAHIIYPNEPKEETNMVDFMTKERVIADWMVFPRFLMDYEIGFTAKWTYTLLYNEMLNRGAPDGDGHYFVQTPVAELARTLHKSESSVKRALQELERAGLVIRRRKAVGAITRTYPLVPVEPGGDAENPLGI